MQAFCCAGGSRTPENDAATAPVVAASPIMRAALIALSLPACLAVACLHQPAHQPSETWQVRTSLHLPEGRGPFPVVLLLPGGRGPEQIGRAWPSYERYAQRLAKLGLAGMVVDYARPDRGYIDERRIPELRVAIDKAKH